jgi:hypothetical protein
VVATRKLDCKTTAVVEVQVDLAARIPDWPIKDALHSDSKTGHPY